MVAKAVRDEALIVREFYNPNPFDVVFERLVEFDGYVIRNKIPLGPLLCVCKSGDFLTLPHAYFKITSKNGCPVFDMVVNFGDERGKGNKLPSLPVIDPRWSK